MQFPRACFSRPGEAIGLASSLAQASFLLLLAGNLAQAALSTRWTL